MIKHQPKIAILSESVAVVRMIVWPAFIIFLNSNNNWRIRLLVIAGCLGISLIFGLLNWLFFTYEITPHEISLTQGIFVKKRTHLSFERIQTITRTQPIYFQPFKVFKVTIETSGKSDDKLIFHALFLPQIEVIETLRKEAQTKQSDEVISATVSQKVGATYQINNRDLCVYALTSLGSLRIFGVLFAIMAALNDYLPKRAQDHFNSWINHQTLEIYAILLVIVVIISVIGVFIRLYNRFFKFTISRTGSHLTISRGLLTTQNMQLRTSRIQAVHYEQSLLRRLVHLVSVSVLLASSGADKTEEVKQTPIMPVVQVKETTHVLQQFLPKYPFLKPDKAPTISRALRYQLRYIFCISCVVVGGLLTCYLTLIHMTGLRLPNDVVIVSVIIVSVFFYVLMASYVKMSDQAVRMVDDYLIIQTSLNFTKHTYFIPREKIQGFATSQSYFMVNKKAQHLAIFVRDSDKAQRVTLRYLKQSATQEIEKWIARVK